jgi:hypothetical protein
MYGEAERTIRKPMSGTAESARWADRIPGSSRILGVKTFEDETSELVRQIFLLELLASDGKG